MEVESWEDEKNGGTSQEDGGEKDGSEKDGSEKNHTDQKKSKNRITPRSLAFSTRTMYCQGTRGGRSSSSRICTRSTRSWRGWNNFWRDNDKTLMASTGVSRDRRKRLACKNELLEI